MFASSINKVSLLKKIKINAPSFKNYSTDSHHSSYTHKIPFGYLVLTPEQEAALKLEPVKIWTSPKKKGEAYLYYRRVQSKKEWLEGEHGNALAPYPFADHHNHDHENPYPKSEGTTPINGFDIEEDESRYKTIFKVALQILGVSAIFYNLGILTIFHSRSRQSA